MSNLNRGHRCVYHPKSLKNNAIAPEPPLQISSLWHTPQFGDFCVKPPNLGEMVEGPAENASPEFKARTDNATRARIDAWSRDETVRHTNLPSQSPTGLQLRHGGRGPAIHAFRCCRQGKSWTPASAGMTVMHYPDGQSFRRLVCRDDIPGRYAGAGTNDVWPWARSIRLRPATQPVSLSRHHQCGTAIVTANQQSTYPPKYARFTSGSRASSRPVPCKLTRPLSST